MAEWLHDAEEQADRAQEMLDLVDKAGSSLDDFTLEQKAGLLGLLNVRVDIVGRGRPRHKGLLDPMTEWHRESGTKIPTEVTDEMWAKVEGILSSTRQWRDVRGCFEVMLDKLRTGRAWNSYSGSEAIGGRSYASLYRRVNHWFGSGEYARALEALGAYQGVAPQPLYVLPPMLVTSAIDVRSPHSSP